MALGGGIAPLVVDQVACSIDMIDREGDRLGARMSHHMVSARVPGNVGRGHAPVLKSHSKSTTAKTPTMRGSRSQRLEGPRRRIREPSYPVLRVHKSGSCSRT